MTATRRAWHDYSTVDTPLLVACQRWRWRWQTKRLWRRSSRWRRGRRRITCRPLYRTLRRMPPSKRAVAALPLLPSGTIVVVWGGSMVLGACEFNRVLAAGAQRRANRPRLLSLSDDYTSYTSSDVAEFLHDHVPSIRRRVQILRATKPRANNPRQSVPVAAPPAAATTIAVPPMRRRLDFSSDCEFQEYRRVHKPASRHATGQQPSPVPTAVGAGTSAHLPFWAGLEKQVRI